MKSFDPWTLPLGGTAFIEASAGTGKTYTLTTLYLRLLVEEDLLPSEILVVTYTQAATAELRERLRDRIRDAIQAGAAPEAEVPADKKELRAIAIAAGDRVSEGGAANPLHRALGEFDDAAIFTIHGFCQRTLSQSAFSSEVAFDAELLEDSRVLEQTLARDLWARAIENQEPEFAKWLLQGGGTRWDFRPEHLSRLLPVLGADEEMPVLPEPLDGPIEVGAEASSEALSAALESALEAWSVEWKSGASRVAPWLLEAKNLSQTSWKVAKIAETWLPYLDLFAETLATTRGAEGISAPNPDLPAWWKKLTPPEIERGAKKGVEPLVDPVFEAFAEVERASKRLADAYEARALALRQDFVREARVEAKRRRDERHVLLFDDLLSELRNALRPPEGLPLAEQLRGQYRFALIDEFQDTDPVQYEIFRRVWHDSEEGAERDESRSGLILIGDPKQAIYSFRGADLHTYLNARNDAGEAAYGLGVNWRSDPGLVEVVNQLFGRPTNAFGIEGLEFERVDPRPNAESALVVDGKPAAGMRVLLVDREVAQARMNHGIPPVVADVDAPGEDKKKKKKGKDPATALLPTRFGRTELMAAFAGDIARLLESGATIDGRAVTPADVAVLCRKKAELERAREALEAVGIPCVDRGDASVFDSREAWELLSLLHAWLRPGDPSRLRAALSTAAQGFDASALAALEDESAELAAFSERYAEYSRIWKESGFIGAFEAWRRGEGVASRLLRLIDGERRLTNAAHLAELLESYSMARSPSRSALAHALERAIADESSRSLFGGDASLLRLERDDHAVSLLTLHRSKGLEFEIVYLPCLWENDSPREPESSGKPGKHIPPVRCYSKTSGQRILDLGSERYLDSLADARNEYFSESLRLLYVGLTRAKRQCVVSWGPIGQGKHAEMPISWLLAASEWDGSGNDRAAVAKTVRDWTDVRWREIWASLGDAAGTGALEVEWANFEPRPRYAGANAESSELRFEAWTRGARRARRTTSFSGLTRNARAVGAVSGPAVIGRDLDVGTGRDLGTGRPDEFETETDEDWVDKPLACEMALFPRGAEAGTLLHDVLERAGLSTWTEEHVRDLALTALGEAGLPASHVDQILHVVSSVSNARLRTDTEPVRLGEIASSDFLAEMEFTLDALSASGAADSGLTPRVLAEILETAGPGTPLHGYASRVARLDWPELRGYLRGFIDAIYFAGGRYYLLDYKSNHLGSTQDAYGPERLLPPMIEHDYVLQYLIYTVALDQHLQRTLVDYTYEDHFGGVHYLFLRGLADAHDPDCGVFFDRPEKHVVRALASRLIAEGSGDVHAD